jgi:heme o synthase
MSSAPLSAAPDRAVTPSSGAIALVPRAVPRSHMLARVADYAVLMKARVTALVVITAGCGFYLGSVKNGVSSLQWSLLHTLFGVGLVAGGTAAMNQVIERKVDAMMRRTAHRPLPQRRMSVLHAACVAGAAIVVGIAYLAVSTHLLAAGLAALTSLLYLGVYTPLKRVSSVCTFIGAIPGALPPVIGWAAARNAIEWPSLVLFGILFLWQFPHFHSIAWLYREDYERADIRMLAVGDRTGRTTVREILFYSLLLIPISLAPAWLQLSGRMYVVGAIILSVAFLWFGVRLAALGMAPSAPHSKARARQLLQASVFYLPLLFALMMLNAIS